MSKNRKSSKKPYEFELNEKRYEIAKDARNTLENDGIVVVHLQRYIKVERKTECRVQGYIFAELDGYGFDENMRIMSELFNLMFMCEMFDFLHRTSFDYIMKKNFFTDYENLKEAFQTFHYSLKMVETVDCIYMVIEKERDFSVYFNR